MSHTGKYLRFLSKGFEAIGNFAFSPAAWALEGCGGNESEGDNFTNEVVSGLCCLACDCAFCLLKTPIACVGEAFTLPIGGATAVIFAALGITGLPFVAAADGVEACAEHCCKVDSHEIEATVEEVPETDQEKQEDVSGDVQKHTV